jgi:hypothetical protein
MGIYVFNTAFLIEELVRDEGTAGSSRDFGKDIIPYLVKNAKAVPTGLRGPACVKRRAMKPTGAMSALSTHTGRPTST